MDGGAHDPAPNEPARTLPDPRWHVRPFFRAVAFVVLGLVGVVLAQSALRAIAAALHRQLPFPAPHVASITALLLVSWLLLRVLDRRSFAALGLWFYRGWGKEFLLGVGIGVALIALVVGVLTAARSVSYQGLAGLSLGLALQVFGLAGSLLIAAAFEEVLFRGYAFQRLVDSLGRLGAVLTFSALFGVGHLNNPSASALSTANTVLAGVLLAVAYLKTRALWMPIGLHWAWNFLMGPILSLPVSGFRFRPMLFNASVGGPTWFSGGAYGPEGSIVLTLGCVAAIVALARARRIAPSAAMEEVLK